MVWRPARALELAGKSVNRTSGTVAVTCGNCEGDRFYSGTGERMHLEFWEYEDSMNPV